MPVYQRQASVIKRRSSSLNKRMGLPNVHPFWPVALKTASYSSLVMRMFRNPPRTLLGVQQVNILGQRQNHIHGLALRRTGVRLHGDAQSEVGFFEIIGGFAKANLSGFNVGTFRVRTDEGVWECPPAHRASSICSHHNICIQSIYPFGMRLLISRRLNLVYADVFTKWRLLRFLQQPLLLRRPGSKQQMKRTI